MPAGPVISCICMKLVWPYYVASTVMSIWSRKNPCCSFQKCDQNLLAKILGNFLERPTDTYFPPQPLRAPFGGTARMLHMQRLTIKCSSLFMTSGAHASEVYVWVKWFCARPRVESTGVTAAACYDERPLIGFLPGDH